MACSSPRSRKIAELHEILPRQSIRIPRAKSVGQIHPVARPSRLESLDLKAEKQRRVEITEKKRAEQLDAFSFRPAVRLVSGTGQHPTRLERQAIEQKARELQPILDEADKDKFVMQDLGRVPVFIHTVVETLGDSRRPRRLVYSEKLTSRPRKQSSG
jgi:hypothetical protein